MTTSEINLTFIGGGNMARSLVGGLLRAGLNPERIRVSDPDPAQRALLEPLGVSADEDNDRATVGADVVVLAVKPQVLGGVLTDLNLATTQLLVSIAAGVGTDAMRSWTSANQPIVRCMPNTPALFGAGITALYASETVNDAQKAQAEQVLSAAGETLWVAAEDALDAVTAVSGSGPAYFFYLMETMIEAGVNLGLDRTTATRLTVQTAYGASVMAREENAPPRELRANVTSPGGTTERAIAIFEAAETATIVSDALTGAAVRSQELREEYK